MPRSSDHLPPGTLADRELIVGVCGGIAAYKTADVVSRVVQATACPVLLAPAMNARMWQNPIVQRNVTALREADYKFVGPEEGWQACRTVGPGRMAEPEAILQAVVELIRERKPK